MDRILQHLSDYASGLAYGDLPQEVIDRTKLIVVDTMGCLTGRCDFCGFSGFQQQLPSLGVTTAS